MRTCVRLQLWNRIGGVSGSAIVTGASSGIGRAIALDLVEAGYDVTAAARRDSAIPGAVSIQTDQSDPAAPAELVAAHLERCGGLDLLVANAGVLVEGTLDDATVEAWDQMFDLNARAPFLLAQAALPALRESGGLVVIVASQAGVDGMPGAPAYSASKHAAIGIAQALVEDGVRATALCPGYVDTPMVAGVPVAPERMIRPEDVASAVRFLLDLSPVCTVDQIVIRRMRRPRSDS
jgi:NAD(P)-dependent dehydrogenase (short-subunit alcohol dehydrogenase family)